MKNDRKKRVPWHITLFTGAVWFLLAGGFQVFVLVVSGLMAAGGVWYVLRPKLRSRKENESNEKSESEM